MLFIKRMYQASMEADGGGSSSSGSITVNPDQYNAIVDEIEKKNNDVISTEEGYVEPEEICLLNNMIPDYQEADHKVEDLLRKLKKETASVISLMRTMRQGYEDVDYDKTQDLQNSGSDSSASSDSASNGSSGG